MGTTGTSKDRLADKVGGGITVAASTGDELRPLRSRDPGCWTDTDRQRKQDGTWSFGAKECGGSSDGASKAVVNADGDNGTYCVCMYVNVEFANASTSEFLELRSTSRYTIHAMQYLRDHLL